MLSLLALAIILIPTLPVAQQTPGTHTTSGSTCTVSHGGQQILVAAPYQAVVLQATSQPQDPATPKPASTPTIEDPAVTALARKIYSQMRSGKVDDTLLTPEMAKAFTPAQLAQTAPVFNQLGDPTRLTLQSRTEKQDNTKTPPVVYTVYTYLAVFSSAELHVQIVLDTAGKVAGYRLTP